MKILNFGSCNIDYVYSIDHIVNPGETESTEKLEIFPGGKGLNQSIAVSRAGVKVFHAACLGKGSELLADTLEKSGVDISYIKYVDAETGHAVIQVDRKGENSIFLYSGSNKMITNEFVDEVLKNFESGDIILLQNEINNLNYIIEQSYKKGLCVILNPSPYNREITKIDFNKVSYVILNRIEASELFGYEEDSENFDCFYGKFPNLKTVLTLGSEGCRYIDSKKNIFMHAFKTEVVDTTAAGDTFMGYFAAGLSKGEAYETILKTASCAAALAVSKKGAAPSIPKLCEVQKTLSEADNGKI